MRIVPGGRLGLLLAGTGLLITTAAACAGPPPTQGDPGAQVVAAPDLASPQVTPPAQVPGSAPVPAPGLPSAPSLPVSFQAPFLLSASALIGQELEHLPTDRKIAALTFDAGANADAVPSILQTLQARNVPATFFLTGNWVRQYPQETRLVGQSFPVGNHSMTHPNFTSLTDEQIRSEVEGAAQLIAAATGRDPRPLFRFPSGDRDARTTRDVNDLGYSNVRWTVDTLGWMGTSGGITVDKILERVRSNLEPGMIVLMHVGSHPTDGSMLDAQALPAVIDLLRGAGYDFVSISGAPG